MKRGFNIAICALAITLEATSIAPASDDIVDLVTCKSAIDAAQSKIETGLGAMPETAHGLLVDAWLKCKEQRFAEAKLDIGTALSVQP